MVGEHHVDVFGILPAQHDAHRQLLLQRNAPRPAGLEAPDEHLTGRVVPAEVFVVGEVRHVLARPEAGGDAQGAGAEPSAPGGVDDEVGLPSPERGRRGQCLAGEPEPAAIVPEGLQARVGDHALGSGRDGLRQHGLVEPRARDVVRVGEYLWRESREREAETVDGRPDEGHARLHAAEACGLLLDAEALEDRDHGRHEGLSDQQFRSPAVVEQRDRGALARQEDGQSGSRWTGADDGHSHRQIFPLGVLGTASTTVNSNGTL